MAKVTGPLHSITASGSIGGTLTMLRQSMRNIAKKKSKPGGQPSAAQLARRAAYKTAAAAWSALTTEQKAAWKPAADAAQITPFNAYMRAMLRAWQAGGASPWDNGATSWDAGASIWN
jgi:hypothetical protein